MVTPMFGKENYHVVDGIAHENPHMVNGKQVQVVYDDGRHFLRTTREKFDIITSDPIDPWVKGCAALNTVEYYQMCRDHLNPGGNMCQWTPIYETNLASVKSVIATFFEVFPHGILWNNEREGYGYQAVLFSQNEPTVINIDEFQRKLDREDHRLVKQSLRDVGFGEVKETKSGEVVTLEEGTDLLATYFGQAPLMKEWSKTAVINTDRTLRLQYLAALGLNSNMGAKIVSSMLEHYRFPDSTFVGSPESVDILRQALDQERRKPPDSIGGNRGGAR
jgi:spermidine synthase